MIIRASTWNEILKTLRMGRVSSGIGADVTHTPAGTILSFDPSRNFEHPWRIHAKWQGDEWRIFVRAGFVNGHDAAITMGTGAETRDVGLTEPERPYLVARWRNPLVSLGMAASGLDLVELPAEGYPKFFELMGVRPAFAGSRASESFLPLEERTREIRACDIALMTPRVATNQEVTIHDPLTDFQTISISTAFNASYAQSVSFKYRIFTVPKWESQREPTMNERLAGTAIEPQTDEIKVATLWIVSPPNPEGGELAVPDGSWVAYAQQDVFWNLAHAPRRQVPPVPPKPITLRTGLVFGIADSIFAALLAPGNSFYNQIQSALNATTFRGEFWTV